MHLFFRASNRWGSIDKSRSNGFTTKGRSGSTHDLRPCTFYTKKLLLSSQSYRRLFIGRTNKYLIGSSWRFNGMIVVASLCFARTDATHRRQRSTFLAMGTYILSCAHLIYPSHLNSDSLHEAFQDPIQGLYASNTSLPLGQRNGLRQEYRFGLYSYCAYTNGSGSCSGHTVASRFQPYNATTSDMLLNYSQFSDYIFVGTTFKDSSYLGFNSHVAYYFLLLGTILATLSLFM